HVVRAVEGRAVELDAELVEAGLEAVTARELRDDDAPGRPADALRRHDLVVERVLEDPVLMDARRVRERVRADDRLVGLYRDAGELGVETAGGHDAIRLHARVGLVVVATDAQRHHDLLEGGVAAALTDAVDAHMYLL